MQQELIHESAGQRTFAVILETGEEIAASLQKFAERERIFAAQITAIGALSDVVLLYFEWQKKEYLRIPVREQVEVVSLMGDIAEASPGKPALHIHMVVGKRDGTAWRDTSVKRMCVRRSRRSSPKAPRICARQRIPRAAWR